MLAPTPPVVEPTPSPVSLPSVSPPPISPSIGPDPSPISSVVSLYSPLPLTPPFSRPPIQCPQPISVRQPRTPGHLVAAIEAHANTALDPLTTPNYDEEKGHIKKKTSRSTTISTIAIAVLLVALFLGLGLGLGLKRGAYEQENGPRPNERISPQTSFLQQATYSPSDPATSKQTEPPTPEPHGATGVQDTHSPFPGWAGARAPVT